ncbi:hypothetical protein FIBSPDRAFT_1037273, partial [Athelia psychrophila]
MANQGFQILPVELLSRSSFSPSPNHSPSNLVPCKPFFEGPPPYTAHSIFCAASSTTRSTASCVTLCLPSVLPRRPAPSQPY